MSQPKPEVRKPELAKPGKPYQGVFDNITTDPFRNHVFTKFDGFDQDYRAWRAYPHKYLGHWDAPIPAGKPRTFEVPNYRTYSSIRGIWQLESVRDILATKGLKDPWIRNEIWRYPPEAQLHLTKRIKDVIFGQNNIGIKLGFAIAVVAIALDHVRWHFLYGEVPSWKYDFSDWFKEYMEYQKHPNQ